MAGEDVPPGRILVLWNQIEEDVYEHLRDDGPQPLPWAEGKLAETMATCGEELERIAAALRGGGHTVAMVNIEDDLHRMMAALAEHRPDAVMNLVDFFGDDFAHEQHVPAIFELLGVSYTGARPGTLELCQRKHRAKSVLRAAGLPTAPFAGTPRPAPLLNSSDFWAQGVNLGLEFRY